MKQSTLAVLIIGVITTLLGAIVVVGVVLYSSGRLTINSGDESESRSTGEVERGSSPSPAQPSPDGSASATPSTATGCALTFTDPGGDAVRTYDDKGPYGIADIESVQTSCDSGGLTFSVTFAPGTDMASSGFFVVLDVNPDGDADWEARCPAQRGDDFSFVADGDRRASLLSFSSCEAPYPTVFTTTSTVTGTTMTATVPLREITASTGTSIQFTMNSSMLLPGRTIIDPSQDQAPNADRAAITVS